MTARGNTNAPQNENSSLKMGSKIWEVSQTLIGWALVAAITFLVSDRNSAWDHINSNSRSLETHILDGKRKHSLIDRDFKEITKDIDELSDDLRQCQLQQQRMLEVIAKLPPDDVEEQILQNTIDINVLKSRMFEKH